jgi:hypothetical protein
MFTFFNDYYCVFWFLLLFILFLLSPGMIISKPLNDFIPDFVNYSHVNLCCYSFSRFFHLMRFEVPNAVKISMLVFWVVTPCGLAGRYKHFEEYTISNLSPEDGDNMFLRNVDLDLQVHTTLLPTRQTLILFHFIYLLFSFYFIVLIFILFSYKASFPN